MRGSGFAPVRRPSSDQSTGYTIPWGLLRNESRFRSSVSLLETYDLAKSCQQGAPLSVFARSTAC
jgi:hypothetical protein